MGRKKEPCGGASKITSYSNVTAMPSSATREHADVLDGLQDSPLALLPLDLLETILSKLELNTWPEVAKVCRSFRLAVERNLHQLSVVDLTHSSLDDKQFVQLTEKVPSAEHLHMDCWALTDEAFEHVSTKICCLELRDVARLTSRTFELVAQRCPNLTNLHVSSAQRTGMPLLSHVPHTYQDLGIAVVLEKCKKLKRLTLDLPDGNCTVASDLKRRLCANLTDLHVYCGGHQRMALNLPLAAIKYMPLEAISISALDLNDFQATESVNMIPDRAYAAKIAAAFPKLEELYIDLGCYMDLCTSAADLEPICALTRLKKLHLAPFNTREMEVPPDVAFRKIAGSLRQLEDLYVDMQLQDGTLAAVASELGTSLKTLHLAEAKETGTEAVEALARHCPNLESLTLFSNSSSKTPLFTAEAWEALMCAAAKGLYRLVVRNLRRAMCEAVAQHCKFLEHIVLRDCEVDDSLMAAIAGKCPYLGFFDVGRNSLVTDAGLEAFARELAAPKYLHTLSFFRVKNISDAGVEALARHSDAWSLEILSLNRCGGTAGKNNSSGGLTDRSLAALADSKIGRTLLDLDVNNMNLTAAAVPILGRFRKLRRVWGLQRYAWAGTEMGPLGRLCPRLIVENGSQEDP
eukprot:tig00001214_g7561.t1